MGQRNIPPPPPRVLLFLRISWLAGMLLLIALVYGIGCCLEGESWLVYPLALATVILMAVVGAMADMLRGWDGG